MASTVGQSAEEIPVGQRPCEKTGSMANRYVDNPISRHLLGYRRGQTVLSIYQGPA